MSDKTDLRNAIRGLRHNDYGSPLFEVLEHLLDRIEALEAERLPAPTTKCASCGREFRRGEMQESRGADGRWFHPKCP